MISSMSWTPGLSELPENISTIVAMLNHLPGW